METSDGHVIDPREAMVSFSIRKSDKAIKIGRLKVTHKFVILVWLTFWEKSVPLVADQIPEKKFLTNQTKFGKLRISRKG
jgi:hypothetical protein